MKKELLFRNPRILVLFVLLAAIFTLCQKSSSCAEMELKQKARDKVIATNFCKLLEIRHVSKRKIDQNVSQQAFDNYIKSIDPLKLYFTKADLEEFGGRYRDQLGDLTTKGDLTPAFEIYNRYMQRLDERCQLANQIIDSPLDFTEDEEFIRDKDQLDFCANDAEIYDRWKKRIKFEFLSLEADKKEKDKENEKKKQDADADSASSQDAPANVPSDLDNPVQKLHRRYNSLQKRIHQTTNDDILEYYLTAIANVYDPHTLYWSPKSWDNFMIQMQLSLEGIGATLQWDDGYTVVKRLVKGGAADKQGELKVDDKVIAVAQGEDGEFEDVVDMKISDVVDKIRGKQGTLVRLEVIPADGSGQKVISIIREKVALEDSAAQSKIFEHGTKPDGTPYKIGIIDLPSFYLDMKALSRGDDNARSTVRDVKKILDDFNAQKVDACVLDLRLNGGGSLPEAVSLTGLFIKTGAVVQVKPSELGPKNAKSLDDPDPGISWEKPLIVLTSKFSASASEIFAGAIKDYQRGIIVGDSTTHGKGSVQSTNELSDILFGSFLNDSPNLGTLKVTIQGFYLPAGESPQLKGVAADVVLPSLTDHLEDISEADLDHPLTFSKIPPAKYPIFDLTSPSIVTELNQKSQERVKNSSDFQEAEQDIALYDEIKDTKTTPLNRDKYFVELERLNTEKEEMEEFEKMMDTQSEIKLDYYLEEVLNISVDYLQKLAI